MVRQEHSKAVRRQVSERIPRIGWLGKFLLGALLFFFMLGIGLWLYYEIFIVRYPGDEIAKERIERIFNLESPVFYDDGVSVLGVFFQEEHRSYVPYHELPPKFVQALVSAEDKNFFSHPGFDLTGILRAFYLNLRASRVVQGGSTITQQTAKNLFKRQKRSLKAKIVELVRALKLEAHYSKEQIVEWYANQFYVSGNGRGVGVAAKYFFDKPVEELTLPECAFLAGCVKAPNRYNPFMQKTREFRHRAHLNARDRTQYVLYNMLKLEFITRSEYEEAITQGIPFRQGRIRYPLNAILDETRKRLERPAIKQALLEAGVENIATSGIRIYTSIRKPLQAVGLRVLRENLSSLETRLSGYQREAVSERYEEKLASAEEIEVSEFLFGTLKAVKSNGAGPELEVELEDGRLGRVDAEGFKSLASALAQYQRGPWATVKEEDKGLILEAVQVGDPVFVRMRGEDERGAPLLTLEQYPEVNGGILVLQDGFIKALVGGMDNIHFNRALDARRQVGSVFKPLVYMAALQLGWNNLDPLNNQWHAFLYQGNLYIPNPDHDSPYDWVSMAWAGVKSENIATVWLFYHLCDRLNLSQRKELAEILDMAPRPDESRGRYIQRIRDDLGILVNRDTLLHTAFEEAREELRTDLIFEGRTEELRALDDFHYGIGVERYLKEREWTDKTPDDSTLTDHEKKEFDALLLNFLRLRDLQEEMRRNYHMLKLTLSRDTLAAQNVLTTPVWGRFYWQSRFDGERIVYTRRPRDRALLTIDAYWLTARMREGRALEEILPLSEVWVDGVLPSSLLDQMEERIERRMVSLREKDPYSLDVLCRVRDFRVTMALRYVVYLAEKMGVSSPLEPVLSIPLGANSVTLEDATRMYQALVTGEIYCSNEDDPKSSTFLITKIEGPDGELLYEVKPHRRRILSGEQCQQVAQILRNVVSHGTGRQANGALLLTGAKHEDVLRGLEIKVPSLGKTGTSDGFRNSSFVGFIPAAIQDSSRLTLKNGVVLAAYVGYDDNRPMKNKRIRIFGASGALPIWVSVAQAAIRYLELEERLDLVDLAFRPGSTLPIQWQKDLVRIPVHRGSGLPRPEERRGPEIRTYGKLIGQKFEPLRFFQPLRWVEDRT
jgi:membrane peptidoglycan carboxypeptidase